MAAARRRPAQPQLGRLQRWWRKIKGAAIYAATIQFLGPTGAGAIIVVIVQLSWPKPAEKPHECKKSACVCSINECRAECVGWAMPPVPSMSLPNPEDMKIEGALAHESPPHPYRLRPEELPRLKPSKPASGPDEPMNVYPEPSGSIGPLRYGPKPHEPELE